MTTEADPATPDLDPDQKNAAGLRGNAVVTAGAGAGKTMVLVERYLQLLREPGTGIDSILALTFTRKAAAEMYGRIHRALAESGDPVLRAKLPDFPKARIMTLDSFCSEIVREGAAEYGYSPDFRVDETETRLMARRAALAFVMERREDPGMKDLLSVFRFEGTVNGLFAGVAAALVVPFRSPGTDFPAMTDLLENALRDLSSRSLAEILDLSGSAGATASRIASPNADCARALGAFAGFLQAVGDIRSRGGEPSPAELAAASAPFLELKLSAYGREEAQAEVKKAAKLARDDYAPLFADLSEQDEFLPRHAAAMRLLDEFAETYRASKRDAGVMDFQDLGACAVDLLSRLPGFRAGWKRRIRYLMIDEFQDDNELQKRLLYLLAERADRMDAGVPPPAELEPDRLFFVGDEKQSIYRFRGADVAVFRGLAGELRADARTEAAVTMSRNYRSHPGLVGFFNELFPRVMGGATKDFEARYASMTAGAKAGHAASAIEYLLYDPPAGSDDGGGGEGDADDDGAGAGDDSGSMTGPSPDGIGAGPGPAAGGAPEFLSPDDVVAWSTARWIADAVRDSRLEVTCRDGSARKASFDDFAVLLRSTSHQHRLERMFRIMGIPFESSAPRGLFLESPANDIHAMTRLVLDPTDREAYAAVLRSPAAGLSDDGFLAVMARAGKVFDATRAQGLDPADEAALGRAASLYGALCDIADRVPNAEFVRTLWNGSGLRLALLSRPENHPFLEHFEFILQLAARADTEGKNLAGFSAALRSLMGTPDRIDTDDVPRSRTGGVRIMTVHKSKGLEFPVVVIPWMQRAGMSDRNDAPWYLSPECGVTINIRPHDRPGAKSRNIFFERAKELSGQMQAAEIKRLFYVACTRAADHLAFVGSMPMTRDKSGASFHALLVGGDGQRDPAGNFPLAPGSVKILPVHPVGMDEYRAMVSHAKDPVAGTRVGEADYRAAVAVDGIGPPRTVSAAVVSAFAAGKAAAADLDEAAAGAADMAFASAANADAANADAANADAAGTWAPPAAESAAPGERHGMPPAEFGTLCHALLEWRLRAASGKMPGATAGAEPGRAFEPDPELFGDMPARSREAAIRKAELLADGFMRSETGRLVAGAESLETEKQFMLLLDPDLVVKGRIDVFAEFRDRILLLDFKTDTVEDASRHAVQMAIYRRAASALVPGKRVECRLFWLRTGAAEEVAAEFDAQASAGLAGEAAAESSMRSIASLAREAAAESSMRSIAGLAREAAASIAGMEAEG